MVTESNFTCLFSSKFTRNLRVRGTARFAYLNLPPIDRYGDPVLRSKVVWVTLNGTIARTDRTDSRKRIRFSRKTLRPESKA